MYKCHFCGWIPRYAWALREMPDNILVCDRCYLEVYTGCILCKKDFLRKEEKIDTWLCPACFDKFKSDKLTSEEIKHITIKYLWRIQALIRNLNKEQSLLKYDLRRALRKIEKFEKQGEKIIQQADFISDLYDKRRLEYMLKHKETPAS